MMTPYAKGKRRRPASLALRLTALVGIATTLVFLAFNRVVVRSLEQHFAQQDAHELQAVVTALTEPLRKVANDRDIAALRQELANAVAGQQGMTYGVYDQAGRTIYAKPGPNLSKFMIGPGLGSRVDANELTVLKEGQKVYRGVMIRRCIHHGSTEIPYRIVAAMDIGFHLNFLAEFKRMLWWATSLVLMHWAQSGLAGCTMGAHSHTQSQQRDSRDPFLQTGCKARSTGCTNRTRGTGTRL